MTLIADAAHPASRALSPQESGYADSGGVRIGYEVFGQGEETLLLLPPWSIVHSRFWKAQVPYLARHFRVITYDPRGNGRSDRPDTPAGYGPRKDAARRARRPRRHRYPPLRVRRPLRDRRRRPAARHRPSGARRRRRLHDARAADLTRRGPSAPATTSRPCCPDYEGWAKSNRHYWQQDFRGYLEFFFGRGFPEPHSTKQIEDAIGWGLEGSPDTLALTIEAPDMDEPDRARADGPHPLPDARHPGRRGPLIPADRGAVFAAATGAELVEFQGAGHLPHARHPVPFNLHAARLRRARLAAPPPPRALAPRDPPAQARALRLLPGRPRPRLARRRDRARAARAAPRPRDRLARPGAGHARARALRRAHPPRQPPPRARVAPHRRRGARARAQRLPGLAADGRDPARQLHALPRRRRPRIPTTCGSATRRGSSTTTCTRTPSSRPPPTRS